jgi:methionyl-tRNA formyltransferase
MNVIAVSNNLYQNTSLFKKSNAIFITKKEDFTFGKLTEIEPEYVFLPHWSYIIPSEIHKNFRCIVFHMTDLPFGRGGSPMQNLISRGIYDTKISAIKCAEKLDAGDVYLKRDFSLRKGSAEELYMKAGEIISLMIDEIIETQIVPVPQRGEIVKFKRRRPEESDIASLNSVEEIYDYIRMLDATGYPRAFLENGNIKFSFSNAALQNGKITANVEIEAL